MYQTEFLLKDDQFKQVSVESIELFKGFAKAYPVLLGLDLTAQTYFLRLGVERNFETIDSDEMKTFIDDLSHRYVTEKIKHVHRGGSTFFEVIGDLPKDQAAFERLIQGLLSDFSLKFEELSLIETDFMGELVEETIAVYLYDETYYLLTKGSSQKIFKKRQKYLADNASQKSALTAGVLMAFLGITLGFLLVVIRWGFVMHLRIHSWLPSLLASIFAFRFYRKNKGPVAKAAYIKLAVAVSGILLVFNYCYYAFTLGSSTYFFQFLLHLPTYLQANHFIAEFTIRSVLAITIVSLYGMLFYLFHKRGQRLINISKVD